MLLVHSLSGTDFVLDVAKDIWKSWRGWSEENFRRAAGTVSDGNLPCFAKNRKRHWLQWYEHHYRVCTIICSLIVHTNIHHWTFLSLFLFDVDSYGGFPKALFKCRNLRVLSMTCQAFKFVPDAIQSLAQLRIVNLSQCPLLETVSINLGKAPLRGMYKLCIQVHHRFWSMHM